MKYLFALFLALSAPTNLTVVAHAQLLQQSDLEYLGAFRLPAGKHGSCQNDGFAYGGSALAFNPTNNSLFVVGHDWCQQVAEINIPATLGMGTYASLPAATVRQTFVEPSEGKKTQVDVGNVKVGGLAVIGNELHFTEYSYYDGDGSAAVSHFKRPLTLSTTGQVGGPYKVGTRNPGFMAGWIVQVPTVWQSSLGGPFLTGQCCISIVTRTSWGPSAFTFNPGDLGAVNPAPANALTYYSQSHPTLGAWNQTSNIYNGTTQIKGVVFPEGTQTVLYIGRQGIGAFCYGSGAACNDPSDSSQGNHAYPYVYQVWAYDAAEFAKVRQGLKQPWDVVPYTVWNFELPLQHGSRFLGGVAYDPGTRKLYIAQNYCGSYGAGCVHVFNVNIPPPPVIEADFTVTTKDGRTITVSRQPTTPASNAVLVVNPSMNVIVNGEIVP